MTPRHRRIVRGLVLLLAAFVVILGVLGYRDGRHGRRVLAERMINHATDFDLGAPPCEPAVKPVTDVRVAYLGVGGLLIEWDGATLVAAPYYTRQGLFDVTFGNLRVDEDAIAHGVEELDPAGWDILLSGHSHYDHLADVPELMLRHAPRARLWTNRSGRHMLDAFPALATRIETVDESLGAWIRPERDGEASPFRFMPLASEHAPHLYGLRYAHGTVEEPWSSWDGREVRSMVDGLTVNYLIDLMDGETIVYRVFYQGSVSPAGVGHPAPETIAPRPVDLALLCAPPYWQVEDYPEGILAATRAGHAMVIHYEDFLQSHQRPLRFVRSLTDGRVDRLLERIEDAMRDRVDPAQTTPLCGPSGNHWSMPLPGEWWGFDVLDRAVLTSTGS